MAREALTRVVQQHEVPSAYKSDGHRSLADRMETEIERYDRRLKRWRPYYYYRHARQRLGTLPAEIAVGQDFDLLVEKM